METALSALIYRQERFVDLAPELPRIFYQHWQEWDEEQEAFPLRPDWQQYLRLETAGLLQIVVARAGDTLAGYFFGLISPSLHHQNAQFGHCDMFYLAKPYRKGFATAIRLRKLFLEGEKVMRDNGAQKLYIHTKARADVSAFLERLGYRHDSEVMCKLL